MADMDFPNTTFTNDWLEDIYAEPLFSDAEGKAFDHANFVASFNANFGPIEQTLGQWDFMPPLTSSTTTLSESDDHFQTVVPTTEPFPQNQLKRSSSPEDEIELPKVKRGRPRRAHASQSSAAPSPKSTSARTPHNVIERKYREGLNSEMERLRMAVPLTATWETNVCATTGKPRPSKAIVLVAAINYIHDLEMERDSLRRSNAAFSRAR